MMVDISRIRQPPVPTMPDFIQSHSGQILGVVSCLDRVILMGTIPDICYPEAMTRLLYDKNVRIFDYTKFVEPMREAIRQNAERMAKEAGCQIEFIRSKNFRKEERIQKILETRGTQPGLVHVFSAMETCTSYQPWHDKASGKTFLRHDSGKCLHYYFYFIHERYGLCYLRVPTWAPFRLQFYFNGHNLLANQLRRKGLGFEMIDNAFVQLDDAPQAQQLADKMDVKRLHRDLDRIATQYCPVVSEFASGYHWSLMQVEYATDLIFAEQEELAPLYDHISRTAIHAVKADNVATFLGRKITTNCTAEVGSDFHTRVEGTRIKHHLGSASIKMYDKFGRVLRIETTTSDVSLFKHHRTVEHRDGTSTIQLASLKKSIYSLPALIGLMRASNERYLDFLANLDDPTVEIKNLEKISRPAEDEGGRRHRGLNLFHGDDLDLFQTIVRGEFNITGFQSRDLRQHLPSKSPSQIGRMLKRLRVHGLLKKIGCRYKYYLTQLGRTVTMTALKLRETVIIPALRPADAR
jgi:hypothetical protein